MLLYLHAGFMVAALSFFASAAGIAHFMRKRHWWLRVHRSLGIGGVTSIVAGLAAVIYMVAQSGEEHFGVLHAYVGAVAALASTAAAVLGQLQFTWKGWRAEIRQAHRRAGAMTLILLFLNILSGLVLAGVLPDMRSF